MDQNEVAIAFDIVLEEIENAIAALNREGSQALQVGKYDVARELMEKGSQVTAFRTKVVDLQKEWINIFAALMPSKVQKRSIKVDARLKRGLRTPEDEFRAPILQCLVDLGGSAPMTEVLDRVERVMKDRLNAYDRLPLPSDSTLIRWRNTAQWARNVMVREGLLASDSPRGVWEITPAGRRWLAAAIEAEMKRRA
ncbi:winged helix-turn-helix domain-containing protein [Roseiflexus castenholzii]|nr:winged helix-turn-helix domain-containing protein [Roseiflexus castenholzii]